MFVSVVIPVYNADRYVPDAVKSALTQPETGEVLLVEDGSQDNSLKVCMELITQSNRVRLLQHRDKGNHGAAASRNVGIKNATCKYIAFLDADDFFLPERFRLTKAIFEADRTIEGVYEAVGVYFENEVAKQRWGKRSGGIITTMSERVPSERLFECQSPIGKLGYCQTGGWTVKREVFAKTGLFDENLRLHQDTAMFIKLAAVGRMVAGHLERPVTMRRVHDHNRILAARHPAEVYRNRILMWGTLWRWGKRNLSRDRQQIIWDRFANCAATPYKRTRSRMNDRLLSIIQLAFLVCEFPELCVYWGYWKKYLNITGVPHYMRRRASQLYERLVVEMRSEGKRG